MLCQVWRAAARLAPVYAALDRLIAKNIARVQAAFASAQVGPHHFQGSTGYGHGDLGRAALDEVMLDLCTFVPCPHPVPATSIATLFQWLHPARVCAVDRQRVQGLSWNSRAC